MERDPILFSWRSAPRQHAAAAGLAIGLGTPLVVFSLLCLRDLVDLLIPGRDGPPRFLALMLPLPEAPARLLPIAPGIPLSAEGLSLAALLGLAGSAIAVAGVGWIVARLCFSAQTRAAARLRVAATDAILRAPPGAREELRALPGHVARALSGLPAAGILVPALTVVAILVALLLSALAAPRLVPATAFGLLAVGMTRMLLLRRAAARAVLRDRETQASEEALGELIQRMAAVRAHGAATFERKRLGLRARAARAALGRAEGALAYARAPALALLVLLPAMLVAIALWRGQNQTMASPVEPGALVAAAAAFTLAAMLVTQMIRLWSARSAIAPAFQGVAQSIDALAPQRPASVRQSASFPESVRSSPRGRAPTTRAAASA